nr:conserved hypothetical protein [Albugo laibachii Nc14]|eukprot:CCA16106.1 conserved hypothetical protein [Albugo laibachii Nc14]
MMECIKYGHEIIGIAHLYPQENGTKSTAEIDSFMFQSVGSNMVTSIATCMDVPLWTAAISGKPKTMDLMYNTAVDGDEVEDIGSFYGGCVLWSDFIIVSASSCGKCVRKNCNILMLCGPRHKMNCNMLLNSCHRLRLTSLTYLWQQNQEELLERMIENKVHAIIVKVAAIGLDPARHLGKSLEEMQPELLRLREKYQLNVCGEGGEYETLALDCPLFKKRIVIDSSIVVMHSDDFCAPVAYLVIEKSHLEAKNVIQPIPKFQMILNVSKSPDPIHHTPSAQQVDLSHLDEFPSATSYRDQIHVRGLVSRLSSSSIQEDLADIFEQLRAILQQQQSCLQDICFVHVYLRSMETFASVNHEYSKHIGTWQPPSRSCVECNDLPVKVLLDCFAVRGSGAARIDPTQSMVQVLHVRSISAWAPSCIGPYSQANTVHDSLIFLAGQIPLNSATMQLIPGEYQEQSTKCFQNANSVLRVLKSHVRNVICGIVYVVRQSQNDLEHVPSIPSYLQASKVESELVGQNFDHRAPFLLIHVSKLPRDSLVEVELTALTTTAFEKLCPKTWKSEGKMESYTFSYQIVMIPRAICLILATVAHSEQAGGDVSCMVSLLLVKIQEVVEKARLYWDQILHFRIFYQTCFVEQIQLAAALHATCAIRRLALPAVSLLPVCGIQSDAFLAIQVTALDIDTLDTKMWLLHEAVVKSPLYT